MTQHEWVFARLSALRGVTEEPDPRAVPAWEFVTTDRALEAMEELQHRGGLSPARLSAVQRMLSSVRLEARLSSPTERVLRALARADREGAAGARLARALRLSPGAARTGELRGLLVGLEPAIGTQLELWAERPDADVPEDAMGPALSERLAPLLELTEGPFQELLEYQGRAYGGRSSVGLDVLLCALRATPLDALFKAHGRLRRVASAHREQGFERLMGERMRGEVDRVRLLPFPQVLLSPGAIHVLHNEVFGGPLAELAATHGAATGLSLALAPVDLPLEQRLPARGHVAHAIGGLFTQALLNPLYLRRYYGLSGKELEQVRRALLLSYLFLLRLHGQLAQLEADYPPRSAREEAALSALRRAAGVDCEPRDLALLLGRPRDHGGLVAGLLAGLRMAIGLRERFDEDYFRNPRLSEVLMGACAVGNTSTLAGLHAELGLEPEWDLAQLQEYV